MRKNKKLSEQPLKWPFDCSFNEYRKYYIENERHTALRNTNKFWFKKLFDSKIKVELTLGEILFIKNEMNKNNNSIFNFSFENEEVKSRCKIITKMKNELEDNLQNPEQVEKVWSEEGASAIYDFTDEEYEQLGTY